MMLRYVLDCSEGYVKAVRDQVSKRMSKMQIMNYVKILS